MRFKIPVVERLPQDWRSAYRLKDTPKGQDSVLIPHQTINASVLFLLVKIMGCLCLSEKCTVKTVRGEVFQGGGFWGFCRKMNLAR